MDIKKRHVKIARNKAKRIIAKRKRKIRLGILTPDEKRIYREKFTTLKGYIEVAAPNNLSLIENTIDVIDFIDKLELSLSKRRSTLVRLNNVRYVDNGAVIVLLSVMHRFKNENVNFNGDFPRKYLAKKKIIDSGFLRNLYDSENNIVSASDTIFTTFRNNVDSALAGYIIGLATTTVFGEPRVVKGVSRALIELMHNTHNHAHGVSFGGSNWYLSIDHNYRDKKVSFSFIDYGVGIFKSLGLKDSNSKWYEWIPKMKREHSYSNNAELMKLILEGKLHATVTGEPYRGKGLPGIHQAAERDQIENLHIISNDVHANVTESNYELLPLGFSGTYVFFELSPNQESYPWVQKLA